MYDPTTITTMLIATFILVVLAIPVFIMVFFKETPKLHYQRHGVITKPYPPAGDTIEYKSICRGFVMDGVGLAHYIGVVEDPNYYEIPEVAVGQEIVIYVDINTGNEYWDLGEVRLREFGFSKDVRANWS